MEPSAEGWSTLKVDSLSFQKHHLSIALQLGVVESREPFSFHARMLTELIFTGSQSCVSPWVQSYHVPEDTASLLTFASYNLFIPYSATRQKY